MSTRCTKRLKYVLLLMTALLAIQADTALARRRGRSNGNNYYNNNYTRTTTTTNTQTTNSTNYTKRIADKTDPASTSYRALHVSYDYDRAREIDDIFSDRIRVFLWLSDNKVKEAEGPIVAEVKIMDLSNHNSEQIVYAPLTIRDDLDDKKRLAYFDVTNKSNENAIVSPSKTYRLFVNLHREADTYNQASLIGRVPLPFYTATSGDSRLDRARQQIVMRTFKEYYYRKNGWRTGEQYPMDCYAYYMWATGFCTVGAENGRTKLHRLFDAGDPYQNGTKIAEIGTNAAIHGDYVRKPGHSFMLLAYDPDLKKVWTMEGNFNSTVEVITRTPSSSWKVGHLRDHHIRPGLFERVKSRLRSH